MLNFMANLKKTLHLVLPFNDLKSQKNARVLDRQKLKENLLLAAEQDTVKQTIAV